jgi:hypothetical protein
MDLHSWKKRRRAHLEAEAKKRMLAGAQSKKGQAKLPATWSLTSQAR